MQASKIGRCEPDDLFMELRKVYADDFEHIYPLLRGLRNRQMSKKDWQRMLFAYPWADESSHRGYAILAGGKTVGFLGTILSQRPMFGGIERFCTFSSWVVEKEHRGPSALMMRSVVADLAGHTLAGYTPAPITTKLFTRLGFVLFEHEQLLVPPLTGLHGLRALSGSFTLSFGAIDRSLGGVEQTIHRDLSGSRARSVLLRRGSAQCYLVARTASYQGLPVADILYLGDRHFFWENRALAHAALLFATGTAFLVVDKRFADGRSIPLAFRYPRPRIYRPSRPEITPMTIDGLYSELIMLRGAPLHKV
jgi:hypothetical protein